MKKTWRMIPQGAKQGAPAGAIVSIMLRVPPWVPHGLRKTPLPGLMNNI